jgi:Ni/Co efflux regulator RcnB
MKRTLIAAAAALFALTGSAGVAMAQPGDHDRDHGQSHDQNHGGYVHHNDWRKGHRMGHDDWARGQHIDYREHHLRAPPRGYEWREVDGNYVMAAVATGLIASIIANSH